MNRRELIKKGLGLSVAATGILGIIPTKSQADPLASLNALIDQVAELNSQAGIINSLDAKLDAAFKAIDDIKENNNVAAINSMEAFINAVEAQREKHITNADADDLIATANNIIYELEVCTRCDVPGCQCGYPCVPPCDGSGGGF